jgi:hydroxyacylglutathione hydrolase
MIFRQLLYRDLGCASYFLADAGEAAVVDPRWEIDAYLELASAEGARIAYVLDTHEHADHVSGRERLAAATGAISYAPADPAAERAGANGHAVLAGDDQIILGNLRLRAWSTPGHRPEHLAIVVSDLSRGEDPWMVLSGDSLLVGALARPDLAADAPAGARALHRSLAQLWTLGDHVELWPGHVGGSLCGGAGLSGKTSSTIGYERRHNPLLDAAEDRFVEELIRDLPPRPPNLEHVIALNRRRAPAAPVPAAALNDELLLGELAGGARIVDGREPEAFDAGHLRGAINLPPGRSQGTRAGWVLSPESRLLVVGSDLAHARTLARALHAVGLWNIGGLLAGDPGRWLGCGLEVRESSSWDVATLSEKLALHETELIDVRERDEWRRGHLEGSRSVPLSRLLDVPAFVPSSADGPLAIVCAGGMRAAFAASVIRRAVESEVIRVSSGGVGDLPRYGIALTAGD